MRSTLLLGAALVGTVGWIGYGGSSEQPGGDFACTVASITDGDTFRCLETEPNGKQIRVRLSGVAARERDGSCSPGHPCPTSSAEAAADVLEHFALGRPLTCQQTGATYGRRAAFCQTPTGVDLSCAMVANGAAARWDRYWGDHTC